MALTTIDTYGIKDGAVQIDDIGTLAGNLTINDSGKLRLGTGLDLQIYHDGTNTIIDNDTGELKISSNTLRLRGNTLDLYNENQTEAYVRCSNNGSVDLYYDNSKKFETASTGVIVTGGSNARSLKVNNTHTSGGEIACFDNAATDH